MNWPDWQGDEDEDDDLEDLVKISDPLNQVRYFRILLTMRKS